MIILTHEIIELVKDNHAWIVLTKSLAMRASFDEYQKSFPSIEKICEDVNLSKPTVIKALQYLQEIGIIQIKKVQKQGFIQRNEYFILTDKIQTVGKMKINAPVKEVDLHQSTTFTSTSKGDLPEQVNDVYSNHKPNLTVNPKNGGTTPDLEIYTDLVKKYLPEIIDNPTLYAIWNAVRNYEDWEEYFIWGCENKKDGKDTIYKDIAWKDWFRKDYNIAKIAKQREAEPNYNNNYPYATYQAPVHEQLTPEQIQENKKHIAEMMKKLNFKS